MQRPSAVRRAVPLLAAALALVVIALILLKQALHSVDSEPQPSTPGARPPIAGSAPTGAGNEVTPSADPTAIAPRNPPLLEDAKRVHDRAVVGALQRFQLESTAPLEQCLNAEPGPRVPYPLIVTFERQPADTSAGGGAQDRFVAAAVAPAPRLGPAIRPSDELGRCLQRLVGRTLHVDSGHVPPGDRFREIVSVLLPEARTPKQETEKP